MAAEELTFLFTDVVGSTLRWETDAVSMADALARHDATLAAAVQTHGGTLLKTKGEGDSTVSVFPAAAAALAAAADAQRELELPVRMAVHVGPAEARDGDYFGPTLNRAARLRAIAHGHQVVCSQSAARRACDALGDGLALLDLGTHRLKDLASPEQVYQLLGDGLAREFPALLSLNRATTNLPAQASSFVGRTEALAHVGALVAEHRLVTLTGAGGSGKTRLAIQAAAEAIEAFPDGVWFAELASISEADNVAHVLAAAIGVTLSPGDANAQIAAALADKRALVLLDNCEHLVEGAAACASEVLEAGPNVRVLATSRERLRIAGETTWAVPPLDVATEAVTLFCDRARAAAPGFVLDDATRGAVISVCARVEGVPLALELAAARVRLLPVAELAARLERHWDILSGGDRTAAPHQRSLRATIDWSHSLLDQRAQRALHRLAVFRGGFDLASAEQLVTDDETSEHDALDILQEIGDKSLIALDYDAGRYKMLETVREYALEHLAANGMRDETQRRHAEHFAAVLRDVEDRILRARGQREALQTSTREHDNITAAMGWALAHDHDLAGQLIGYSFAPWFALGVAETEQWYRRLVPFVDDLAPETAPRALLAVGAILGYLGEKDTAFALLRRAADAARALGDDEMLGIALSLRASVHRVFDELAEALPITREALALRTGSDRLLVRALICSWGAWVLFDNGFTEEARATIVESHKLCLELDDHVLRASVLDSIGYFMPGYMSAEKAMEELAEERAWLQAAGASDTATALVNADWSILRDQRWEESLARIDDLLAQPQTHWRLTFAWSGIRAGLLHILGKPEEAAAIVERLYAEARTTVDRHRMLCELAVIRRDVGDLDGSERAASEALHFLLNGHNPEGGWGTTPTRPLAGLLLRLMATHRVQRGAPTAEISRLLGVSDALLDVDERFLLHFELFRVNLGFADAVPPSNPEAAARAVNAPIAEAVAYALGEAR